MKIKPTIITANQFLWPPLTHSMLVLVNYAVFGMIHLTRRFFIGFIGLGRIEFH